VAQTIQDSVTPELLTFDTEEYDYGGLHSTVANTNRFTATVDGVWRFTVNLQLESTNVGVVDLYIRDTGTQIAKVRADLPGVAATMLANTVERYLTTGDYFDAQVWQTTGANRDTLASATRAQMSLVRRA
jgi:hypothetical protein